MAGGRIDLCIISMCFVSFLSNSAYALIAPFLPFEFQKNGVPLTMMGYIFRYPSHKADASQHVFPCCHSVLTFGGSSPLKTREEALHSDRTLHNGKC